MSHILYVFLVIPILFAQGQEFVTNAGLKCWIISFLFFFPRGCVHHDLMKWNRRVLIKTSVASHTTRTQLYYSILGYFCVCFFAPQRWLIYDLEYIHRQHEWLESHNAFYQTFQPYIFQSRCKPLLTWDNNEPEISRYNSNIACGIWKPPHLVSRPFQQQCQNC